MEHSLLNSGRIGLYIHVPFCKSKCAYCDFYRIVDLGLVDGYVEALKREMDIYSSSIDGKISTIYIGGGTPSILKTKKIGEVLRNINEKFDCSEIEEFTVECNPEDIDENLAKALYEGGVNRISLGVQSMNDSMLRFLNRRHSGRKINEAIEILRAEGFRNISVDMIFGLPKVGDFSFKEDVDKFIGLGVEHLSAYSLSYEEGSWLTRLVNEGKVERLDDDEVADQYAYLTMKMKEAGYDHYEISNYCKKGFHSRHNSDCWKRIPYIGMGPGSYSFDGKKRWNDVENVREYIKILSDESMVMNVDYMYDMQFIENIENIDEKDIYNEVVMLGLRTNKGVRYNDIPKKYIRYFDDIVSMTIKDGMVEKVNDELEEKYYKIPEEKLFLLDMITEKMML
ncbi:MAG: radical SAM family heme chaperone HemW [Bacteroidales bacterium]|nr:radical SAM family heme chaperone HemW [Bacteroidales bacterium]